jgi:hypothetical protein
MKFLVFVLALAVCAISQEATSTTDTLIASKQITIPQAIQRPNFRRVTRALNVGDSVRVVLRVNNVVTMDFKYTVARGPLDTANVTKMVLMGYIDDCSK